MWRPSHALVRKASLASKISTSGSGGSHLIAALTSGRDLESDLLVGIALPQNLQTAGLFAYTPTPTLKGVMKIGGDGVESSVDNRLLWYPSDTGQGMADISECRARTFWR